MSKRNMINSDGLFVSTRVRLARNIERLPFKTKNPSAFEEVANTIKRAFPGTFGWVYIAHTKHEEAQALYEQHLISRELLENETNGMIVNKTKPMTEDDRSQVCIMLGEEDHIRIQVINVGLDLQSAHATAKQISDAISREHPIARDPELGYLTSCPTNLGTAMRASVMMFLPALSISGAMASIVRELAAHKITVRGVYGEGSKSSGHMYQISNQATMHLTEAQILKKVNDAAQMLAKREVAAQAEWFTSAPDTIIDRVYRAFGILTHAHKISSDEAMDLLAWLKLGDCLSILRFKPRALDDLFFVTKPATLITQNERSSDILTRDKMRAKKIATVLRSNRMK
ncbi:MAG: hypothetical protein FWE38_01850 [Firmicutes bacterium]|nr:hypothetical protein [Bacillota bacterium]